MGNGVCVHGSCHCTPGWSGVNCSSALPCPNGCSAHGVCMHGACHCDPGYSANDCSVAPRLETEAGLVPVHLAALSAGLLVVGVAAGAGLKAASDKRRRVRLMRFIEEGGDGQGPFVSEVRQAIIS